MAADEGLSNSIKQRLRSSGEALAQQSLETAKNAAKGLENTHAAYLYPLQVLPPLFDADVGDILLSFPSRTSATLFLVCCHGGRHVSWYRHCNLFLRLPSSSNSVYEGN